MVDELHCEPDALRDSLADAHADTVADRNPDRDRVAQRDSDAVTESDTHRIADSERFSVTGPVPIRDPEPVKHVHAKRDDVPHADAGWDAELVWDTQRCFHADAGGIARCLCHSECDVLGDPVVCANNEPDDYAQPDAERVECADALCHSQRLGHGYSLGHWHGLCKGLAVLVSHAEPSCVCVADRFRRTLRKLRLQPLQLVDKCVTGDTVTECLRDTRG